MDPARGVVRNRHINATALTEPLRTGRVGPWQLSGTRRTLTTKCPTQADTWMGLGPTRERLVDPMTESSDGKPISAYEKLISNLDYDNSVQRSDNVVGVITQVYPDWAMWTRSEPSDTEFYQTIDESNASEFTVLDKP